MSAAGSHAAEQNSEIIQVLIKKGGPGKKLTIIMLIFNF
jgi:hypothetical protein